VIKLEMTLKEANSLNFAILTIRELHHMYTKHGLRALIEDGKITYFEYEIMCTAQEAG